MPNCETRIFGVAPNKLGSSVPPTAARLSAAACCANSPRSVRPPHCSTYSSMAAENALIVSISDGLSLTSSPRDFQAHGEVRRTRRKGNLRQEPKGPKQRLVTIGFRQRIFRSFGACRGDPALLAPLEPAARRPAANVSWPEAFPAECDPSALSPRAKRLMGQYRSEGDMDPCASEAVQADASSLARRDKKGSIVLGVNNDSNLPYLRISR